MQWLVASVVLSVVLTVLLNVALRMFPNASERAGRGLADLGRSHGGEQTKNEGVSIFVPWKAMILASVILTIAINVFFWLT